MSRIKRDGGILVLVVLLLGIAAWQGFPVSKTRLGLDLKGGASVVLEATNIKDVTSSKMDQTVSVIRNRVDRLGVAEPEIQRLGTNQISVQLPGATSELLKDIGRTAVLGFWDIKQFGTGYFASGRAQGGRCYDDRQAPVGQDPDSLDRGRRQLIGSMVYRYRRTSAHRC